MNALFLVLALLPAAEPEFVLASSRDERPIGKLARWDANGTVQIAGATPVHANEFVSLRRRDIPPPNFPHDRPHAHFANGDRIPGTPGEIVGDTLTFRAELGVPQDLQVPLSTLTALFFTERGARRASELPGRRVLSEKRRQDIVWLTNGDTLAGTASALSQRHVLRLDATDIARDRIDAILFNSELSRPRKTRGLYYLLVLCNGTRLSIKSASLTNGELACMMIGGGSTRIPLAEIAALSSLQGCATYLSDLVPTRYEFTPYLRTVWPLAIDRSCAGLDLALVGGTYDKGLGMHSQCRVTYSLPAKAKRFEAMVGLDEITGRAGAVRVSVEVGGKVVALPIEITIADAATRIGVPLPAGSRELTLIVEFGRGGDVQDHVDWADARVIVGP